MRHFRIQLRKLLIDKNMNKVVLRDAIVNTLLTLSKLSENHKINMDVLEKICKELNYNVGDIIDYISN